MSFSYQFGANPQIDYPRLLVADTVDTGHIWEDSEILAAANICSALYITATGAGQTLVTGQASYRYTAATLLDSLAANKARLANALKVLDIQVDTRGAAQELRAQAQALRDQEMNDGSFAIIEQTFDQFAARERLWKQMVRLQT
jgi:hypothetical protein